MPKWLGQSKSFHRAPVPRGRNLQPEANKGRKHVSITSLSPRRASRKTRRSTDVVHCIGPNLHGPLRFSLLRRLSREPDPAKIKQRHCLVLPCDM